MDNQCFLFEDLTALSALVNNHCVHCSMDMLEASMLRLYGNIKDRSNHRSLSYVNYTAGEVSILRNLSSDEDSLKNSRPKCVQLCLRWESCSY